MNYEEVMKALECCANGDPCKGCPANGTATCVDLVMDAAKSTIERKDETLNMVKQEYDLQFAANKHLLAENELLKEKIKRLEKELKVSREVATNFEAECNQQDAEIERLKAEVEKQKIKAVQRFANELMKKSIDVDVSCGYGKRHYTEAVPTIEIYNTLEEWGG